jgi:hypothetical protein
MELEEIALNGEGILGNFSYCDRYGDLQKMPCNQHNSNRCGASTTLATTTTVRKTKFTTGHLAPDSLLPELEPLKTKAIVLFLPSRLRLDRSASYGFFVSNVGGGSVI